jgi:hypothetical protein
MILPQIIEKILPEKDEVGKMYEKTKTHRESA